MGRYWKIYRTFFVSSFSREIEFRANFLAKIAQNLMWIAFFILILLVVYGNTNSVAGWSKGDSIVLAGTVFLMNAFAQALFFSLTEIPEQVRRGTLDYVVTRPVDSQFWVSTRRFNFDQIGSAMAGVVMVIVGVTMSHSHPGLLSWLAFVVLSACSLAIFYAFNLALMTTGIWLIRVDNLWVLSESLVQVARYPMDIYSSGLQRMMTFLVPLGFLATIPARQLVRAFDAKMLVVGLIWSLAALFLSRRFWMFAMRHYGSASS